jgi:protein phosphatase
MAGLSDIGRRRKANQDSMYFDSAHGMAIVADGIGGRRGGEVASSMAVAGLKQAFMSADKIRHEEVAGFLGATVDQVNQEILVHGQVNAEVEGLGTTLNGLVFVGSRLYIAHVGDSRTYMLKGGNFWQLTIDHNIETFVRRGWMPKSVLEGQNKASALVRSLGLTPKVEIDVYEVELSGGETFVTCSDGLSGMVEDRRIAEILARNIRAHEKLPKLLVDEANRNGGRDNITVVVSQVGVV